MTSRRRWVSGAQSRCMREREVLEAVRNPVAMFVSAGLQFPVTRSGGPLPVAWLWQRAQEVWPKVGLTSTNMHGLVAKLAVLVRKCSLLDSAAAVGNLGEGNPASEELEFMLSLISLREMEADGVTDAARRHELLASMQAGLQGWDVCDVAEYLAGMACRARV